MAGWLPYSVTTLGQHLRGTIARDPDARGGTVPDRISAVCREAGIALWNQNDWKFRRKQGTLKLVGSQASAGLPSDFSELRQKWLRDQSSSVGDTLRFTDDPEVYQNIAGQYEVGDTGEPMIALIVNDTDYPSAFAWKALIAPPPDQAAQYPYWYVINDPWTRRGQYTTASTTANANLTFTALAPGNSGTLVTIALTAGTPFAVGVTASAITVTYVAGVTTAAVVKAAVNVHAGASALARCDLAAGEDGSGIVSALTTTSLTGPIADATVVPWPATFNEGWRMLAAAQCMADFGKPDEASVAWRQFAGWIKLQRAENDDTITPPNEQIPDGYLDHLATTSANGPSVGVNFFGTDLSQ